jgi:hypothetical protein
MSPGGQFLVSLDSVSRRGGKVTLDLPCLLPDDRPLPLVAETPEGNLSKGMRHLDRVSTKHRAATTSVAGTCFRDESRPSSRTAMPPAGALLRWVPDPVRVGTMATPGKGVWSSYRAMAGEATAPCGSRSTAGTWCEFESKTRSAALVSEGQTPVD